MTSSLQQDPSPDDAPETRREFESLLEYLKQERGFDFIGYKRSSLMRRVRKRMQTVEVEDFAGYLDYLAVHPNEFDHLFNTILINVTSFFRDPSAWEYLAEEILPRLLAGKDRSAPLRVWSACCASGEEAYTITILLAEALGLSGLRDRVKVYATDIDGDALDQARQASYTSREVAGVPAPLLEKYFEQVGTRYIFHKELRRVVIFGRHDLIQDAPISRVDLLTCRNALMYFNAEVQAKVLSRLHFALNDGGILFLGKAEMLFTHTSLFAPVDAKRRIFSKVPKVSMRERLLMLTEASAEQELSQMATHVRMRESAFEAGPLAQIVVDVEGQLALANDRARALFRVTTRDIGRPLQDLEISYRPAELRSMIDRAYMDRHAVLQREIPWNMGRGETTYLDVQVAPLLDSGSDLLGAIITFSDVTGVKQLQEELQEANRELETAYEELQSTNEELQSTNEELETTNEELQSTNEELETTNEELQSTNEELVTMNEELQSTNEEMQTVNDEVRLRSTQLNQANGFLVSILSSLRIGVVVLDSNLLIQVWNRKSEDLWDLRADEVQQQQFLILDVGLPVERLKKPIRDCLARKADTQEIILEARNRRGKDFACRVTCTPLNGADGIPTGVILLMEEAEPIS